MIEPNKAWERFQSTDEKTRFMKELGLLSATASYPKTVVYSGYYVDRPTICELVGHVGTYSCVLEINGSLHCIDPDLLAEMQIGKAGAALPDEYVVLDFETTGFSSRKDEIIEIAAVKYIIREEVGSYTTLVKPEKILPFSIQEFTGIRSSDLVDAPPLKECVFALYSFLGNLPIIAHNASFERSFLTAAYERFSLKCENQFIDSLNLARKCFPNLDSYKLKDLKNTLGLSQKQSHRALADVYNTQELLLICSQRIAEGLIDTAELPMLSPESDKKDGNDRKPKSQQPVVIATVDNALRGKVVVFTGELSFSRKTASDYAEAAGASVTTSVSRKTDYLIVGKQDLQAVGFDGISRKEAKARQLNKEGCSIQIVDESSFISLLTSPCDKNTAPTTQPNNAPSEPSQAELDAFDILTSILSPVMRTIGLDSHSFSLIGLKERSSVYLGENDLFCRFRFRGGKSYVELPVKFRTFAQHYGQVETPVHKATGTFDSKDFCKLICKKPEDILKWKSVLIEVLYQTIDELPTDFGCCSRYIECSDAKKCLNPNKDLALQCYYLKNLLKGNILYGKNAIGHPIEFK